MHSRPFRGILGAALLLAGLGPDLQPPPRAPPRPEEIEALAVELTGAGINMLELAEHVGQDLHEFVRVGRQCLGIFKMLLAQGQRVTVVADLVRKHDELVGAIPAAGTERAIRLGGDRSATAGFLEVTGRRGPGIQLRDERTRVGEPLRILAQYAGMTSVELGEIERGLRVPTSQQWAALQVALPDLGPMEAPPTEAERSPVLAVGEVNYAAELEARRKLADEQRPIDPTLNHQDWGWCARCRLERYEDGHDRLCAWCWERRTEAKRRVERDLVLRTRHQEPAPGSARARLRDETARLEAALHPTDQCTCGGEGRCEWCVMDQRRGLREARLERRRLGTTEAGYGAELTHKRETRRAKQARKARRGW